MAAAAAQLQHQQQCDSRRPAALPGRGRSTSFVASSYAGATSLQAVADDRTRRCLLACHPSRGKEVWRRGPPRVVQVPSFGRSSEEDRDTDACRRSEHVQERRRHFDLTVTDAHRRAVAARACASETSLGDRRRLSIGRKRPLKRAAGHDGRSECITERRRSPATRRQTSAREGPDTTEAGGSIARTGYSYGRTAGSRRTRVRRRLS